MYVYIIGGIGCRSENLDQNYLDQKNLAKKNRMHNEALGQFLAKMFDMSIWDPKSEQEVDELLDAQLDL